MSIHARIKQRRLELGLSMKALAALVGAKSWQTVQQWEQEDGTAPSRQRLPKVAEALQTTVVWLTIDPDESAGASVHQLPAPYRAVPGAIPANANRYRKIPAYGKAMGGFPERIWDEDGGFPAGFSDVYAEVASADPNSFLTPVEGLSMSPRYNPGEYALVEPNTDPEIEDDVLVRLSDGRTMLKRLLSRRGAVRLGSYSNDEIISSPPEQIVWMYYVAHPVPARKIKQRL